MTETWLFDWVIWASLAVGAGVGGFVFFLGWRIGFARRRRQAALQREEDLPWEQLLELLKQRYEGRSAVDENLSPDELMEALLGQLAKKSGAKEAQAETDRQSRAMDAQWSPPGSERRSSRRRWLNPVVVMIISPVHADLVQGLVFNRSEGGLAILTDMGFEPGTKLAARAVHAPDGIGYARIVVRHARQVSKLWIIGCEYAEQLPWNVKVWFG